MESSRGPKHVETAPGERDRMPSWRMTCEPSNLEKLGEAPLSWVMFTARLIVLEKPGLSSANIRESSNDQNVVET